MKTKDLIKLTEKEKKEKVHELQQQLVKERAQAHRGTQTKNPMLIKNTRKTIAKLLQLLHRKKMEDTKKA